MPSQHERTYRKRELTPTFHFLFSTPFSRPMPVHRTFKAMVQRHKDRLEMLLLQIDREILRCTTGESGELCEQNFCA